MAAAADRVVLAHQGEMVDELSQRFYGTTAMTEAILAANRGLAELGPRLPHGTPVTLPPRRSQPRTRTVVNLWD